MNYVIIDDEPIAHRILESYCNELPLLHKVGNAYNALEASEIIIKQKVDLIFLDIQMPKITGFEFLKSLAQPPKVIVTTAYKEFALEGYELNVVDYLLKPFSLSRFLKAVYKVNENNKMNSTVSETVSEVKNGSIFLKGDKVHHQIQIRDILFVEAYSNYVKVYSKEKMIVIHEKISTLETILSKHNVLRVHKSFLVTIEHITSIQGNRIHIQDYKIPIGQTYKNSINQLINNTKS
ncbi:Two-component system response regulator [Tenacibaculum sp. 190524A05c]|uniref:LytR/AlgR family response regulator transcription factor n=1 Tax=Tenacibaculum platacis TaxID=3137852 RepID=UPI0031FB7A3A